MQRSFGTPAAIALVFGALGLAVATAPVRATPTAAVVQDASTLVSEARALVKEGRFAEALPKFSAAIKERPDYVAAYADRGACYFNLKRYAEAMKDFSKVVELKPSAADGYFNRGTVSLNLPTPDIKQALADFTKVIELNPKPRPGQNLVLESYDKRAYCFVMTNQWQEAILDCGQVIQADPKRISAYLNRAFAYTNIKPLDAAKAIADYSAVLANTTSDDDKRNAIFGRAELHLKAGNTDAAIADLNEGIKLSPNAVEAYAARAAARYQKGLYADAVTDYSKVIQLKPSETEVLKDRAATYMQLKDYAKAASDYTDYLKRVPNPATKDILKLRAAAYMNMTPPNYGAAIPDYRTYLASNANDPVAWHDLAAASFLSSGSKAGTVLDEAIAAAEKALSLKADQADMNLVIADGRAIQGKFEASLPYYTKYIELKGDDPAGYEGRGRALFNAKKYKEATADFDSYLSKAKPGDKDRAEVERLKILAMESDPTNKIDADQRIAQYSDLIAKAPESPDSAVLYTNRGVARFNKGDFDAAIKDFEQAAKLDGGQKGSLVNIASALFRKADKSKVPADFTAASVAYDKVLAKDPADKEAWLSRADINLNLKKYTEAIADYGKVIATNPDTPTLVAVLTNRAAAYLMLPKPDAKAAVADYTAILAKTPGDPTVLGLRAMAHKSVSDWAAAAADFTKVIDLAKPKVDTDTLLARAECLFNLAMARKDTPTKGAPEFDGAIADYSAVLAQKADNVDALFSRGLVHYRKSGRKSLADLTKAIADFDAALKLKADHADSLYRLALACDDYGVASEPDQEVMFNKAIASYEKYIALPGVPAADVENYKKRIAQLKDALGL